MPAGFAESEALTVSADRRVAGGSTWTLTGLRRPVRWTAFSVDILPLPPGTLGGAISGASADGSILVGSCQLDMGQVPEPEYGIARWDSAGASIVVATGYLVPPFGLSASGERMALTFGLENWLPYVADSSGISPLPLPPAFAEWGRAAAISADGLAIVGDAGALASSAMRWVRTPAAWEYQMLPLAPGGAVWMATTLSGEGSVVFGAGGAPGYPIAIHWTAAGGVREIGSFRPAACAADGLVVIGNAPAGNGFRPYLWSASQGPRLLTDVLMHEYALDLTGWSLSAVSGISADGDTLVGSGRHEHLPGQFRTEGWIAHLGPPCYANCDRSLGSPALNVDDFVCFQSRFAASDPYANCDESAGTPALNVLDFVCFMQKFAAGCP